MGDFNWQQLLAFSPPTHYDLSFFLLALLASVLLPFQDFGGKEDPLGCA